jgi:outer membrane protein OmpA-like peptidoglycan-associated protein
MRGVALPLFLGVLATANAHALTPEQVFDRVKDSIYIVRVLDGGFKGIAFGSGVMLPSGHIGTNCHVLEDGSYYRVGKEDDYVFARLFAGDVDKDICLLEAVGLKGKPATLGSSKKLKVGQPVYTVGAPEGLELSFTGGFISQIRKGLIQTSAPISHGSSGGGLFDTNAMLIGFTTLTHKDGQNLNFAIPVEWIYGLKKVRVMQEPPAASSPSRDGSGPSQEGGGAGGSFVDPTSPINTATLPKARFIYFNNNDDVVVLHEYLQTIKEHAIFLRQNSNARIVLQGHTWHLGSREWNLAIGQLRAENVMRELVRLGAPPEQIEMISLGEEKPLYFNVVAPEERLSNRVTILYQGE